MNNTKNSFVTHGIINIVIHFPMLIVTSFWGLFILGIFNIDSITEPFWDAVTMFPLLVPPISCIAGIIRGVIYYKKDTQAPLCLGLSVIGLFIYIGMIILCGWLGTIA